MPERHATGGEPTLQQVPTGAARYTARAVARQRIPQQLTTRAARPQQLVAKAARQSGPSELAVGEVR